MYLPLWTLDMRPKSKLLPSASDEVHGRRMGLTHVAGLRSKEVIAWDLEDFAFP